jgi:hypothetical protein
MALNVYDVERIQAGVLRALKQTITSNTNELELAYKERPIGAIAWFAGNLLELLIWSEYCASSQANAKEFLLDAARDAFDVLDIPEDVMAAPNSLQARRQMLIGRDKEHGFNIEDSYTRVANAAEKLGKAEMFKYWNKTFSKFAHPTAFVVISGTVIDEPLLRKRFYDLGLFLSQKAMEFCDAKIAV